MENSIATIVVTYNRKELLLENLKALTDQSFGYFDIYIIDNNSSDGTYEAVEHLLNNRIIYYNTGENLGGAGGFAYGIKKALNNKNYEYVWIMDDDTIPEKDSLESMVNKAVILNNDFSFIASIAIWTDGTSCLMNAQPVVQFATKNYNALSHGLIEISSSSFVSCFINVELIRKVGLPIKEFFIYGDDVEYTRRLNKEKQGYLDIGSIVLHKMNDNSARDLVDCEDDRIDRYEFESRNWIYICRHTGVASVLREIIRKFWIAYKIITRSKTSKAKRLKALFAGTIKGFWFNPKIEYVN